MNDWQALVETEGVALTTPVLKRAFPQGIAQAPRKTRADVREKLGKLRDEELHRWEWTRFLLRDVLGYGERLVEGTDGLIFPIPERRSELAPDMVLVDPAANGVGRHRLLVVEVPHGTPFDKPLRSDANWAATPTERAERLCRDARVELGILTDSDLLRVIWAGPDGQVGQATWPTEFLGDERDLLSAFVELLGAQRFFAVAPENRLDALYRESVTAQQEFDEDPRPPGAPGGRAAHHRDIPRRPGRGRETACRRRAARGVRGSRDRADADRVPSLCGRAAASPARRPGLQCELRDAAVA